MAYEWLAKLLSETQIPDADPAPPPKVTFALKVGESVVLKPEYNDELNSRSSIAGARPIQVMCTRIAEDRYVALDSDGTETTVKGPINFDVDMWTKLET